MMLPNNYYDIVHMSNALDHCFDPLEGIYQLLTVVKVGGKIILRHNDNEAEHEKYTGFHQWNLTIVNGEFQIWRKGVRPINVQNIIKEVAEVEIAEVCEEKLFDDVWKYNKIIIRKTHEFDSKFKYAGKVMELLLNTVNKLELEKRD